MLTAATFAAITTEIMPVGLLRPMSESFGVDEATVGLLVSVYALAVTVLALPVTLATTRMPRKRLLVGTLVAYAASNLVIALAPTFALAAVGRGIGGLAHAVFFSVVTSYASELVPHHLVGRALAIVYAGTAVGSILGLPLATTIGTTFGWPVAFLAVAGVTVLLAALALALPSVAGSPAQVGISLRTWWRRGLMTVASANGMLYLGHFALYTFITPLLLTVGVSLGAVGPALLLFGVAGIVGLWISGAFVDRRPRRLMLALTALLLLALVALAVLVPSGSLVGVLVACCVWTLTLGALPSLFMTAAVRTGGAPPDIVGALINMFSNIGISAGAAVGGLVFTAAGIGALPVFALVLVAASLALMLVARRRAFPPGAPRPPAAL
ncbi:MFS transporter [Subtercola sp. Z020]|nr:MFS transporter [Subtercola sp. Z020]